MSKINVSSSAVQIMLVTPTLGLAVLPDSTDPNGFVFAPVALEYDYNHNIKEVRGLPSTPYSLMYPREHIVSPSSPVVTDSATKPAASVGTEVDLSHTDL